jgi:pimeloyl-ACP methyl ester carboxylesterase
VGFSDKVIPPFLFPIGDDMSKLGLFTKLSGSLVSLVALLAGLTIVTDHEYSRIRNLQATSLLETQNLPECFFVTKLGVKLQYFVTNPEIGCDNLGGIYLAGGPGAPISLSEYQLHRFVFRSHNIGFVNAPGTGTSSSLSREDSTVSNIVDLYSELLIAKGRGRSLVIGGSWGAIVAARIAVKQPEKVLGLILISPGPMPLEDRSRTCAETTNAFMHEAVQKCFELRTKFQYKTISKAIVAEAIIRYRLLRSILSWPKPNNKIVAELLDSNGVDIVSNKDLAQSHATTPILVPSKSKAEHFPVLILFGALDPISDFEREGYKKLFPQASILELAGAGHELPRDCEVLQPIAQFAVRIRYPDHSVSCQETKAQSNLNLATSSTKLKLVQLMSNGDVFTP